MKEIIPYLNKSRKEIWYSKKYIETLVDLFENHKLPKEMWTNDWHIMVWIYYSLNAKLWLCTIDNIMELLRNNIKSHNKSVWVENTIKSWYHETITRFWKEILTAFVMNQDTSDMHTITNDFLQTDKSKSEYIFEFYSKELLFSLEARRDFVEPDIQSIPL